MLQIALLIGQASCADDLSGAGAPMMGLIVRRHLESAARRLHYRPVRRGVAEAAYFVVMLYYPLVAFFVLGVLGAILRVAGLNIFAFLACLREELTIVLGTTSSDAVCPRTCASPSGWDTQIGGRSRRVPLSAGVITGSRRPARSGSGHCLRTSPTRPLTGQRVMSSEG